jgi:hypothetical protein
MLTLKARPPFAHWNTGKGRVPNGRGESYCGRIFPNANQLTANRMHEYPRYKILARNPEKRPERELLAKQRYIKIYFIIFCIPIYLNMYKITHMLQGKFRGYEIKIF